MENKRGQKNSNTNVLVPVQDVGLNGEIHEFMARPAPWLLRSGTTVLAILIALLLGLSLVIKYPDTITAKITVTGTQPVAEVVARQSGQLESLRVTPGQRVKKDEILAVLQSPSRSATVLALVDKLAEATPAFSNNELPLTTEFKAEEGLGQIQNSYAEFLNAYHKLRDRIADDYATKAGSLIQEQLVGKEAQIQSLQTQTVTNKRELELAEQKYQRAKSMHKQSLISTAQLQEDEAALLKETGFDTSAQRELAEARIEAAKLKKELRDLEHEHTESIRIAREELRAALNKLQGGIAVWYADYVLCAPSDGVVAFYDFWSNQQFVTAGRHVFLVVPDVRQLLGRMAVNQGGAGKIKPDQTVRIELDDYPYKEFGIVTGKVQSVSLVARDGANMVLVDIPYPLSTSFRREVHFKQDMTGEGRIITEDISLLGRVLYEIRRAFVNNID